MPRVAILQYDDRSDSQLGPLRVLVARNEDYAARQGYAHFFIRTPERDLPPHWLKVHLIDRLLREGFDMVAWLDTDAVVHDPRLSIPALFEGEAAFVFAGEPPIWAKPSPFNAGVFFCKGDAARALISAWLALYPAPLWKKQDGEWNHRDHVWAGPAYEQGAFVEQLLPRHAADPALRALSWRRLQSPFPLPESLTLHFPNVLRPNAMVYLTLLREGRLQEN